jgi:Zn-dependent membrane protease YugP
MDKSSRRKFFKTSIMISHQNDRKKFQKILGFAALTVVVANPVLASPPKTLTTE